MTNPSVVLRTRRASSAAHTTRRESSGHRGEVLGAECWNGSPGSSLTITAARSTPQRQTTVRLPRSLASLQVVSAKLIGIRSGRLALPLLASDAQRFGGFTIPGQ